MQVLAVMTVAFAMAQDASSDGDYHVSEGVVVVDPSNEQACQDCTCLADTCNCRATTCASDVGGRYITLID
jgi:hypothetical protein